MGAKTVTKFGRDFEFDEDTPDDVAEKRILNWMRENAATELPQEEGPPAPKPARKNGRGNAVLDAIGHTLAASPIFAPYAMAFPQVREMLQDPNAYRTFAQGALPFADEGIAGVRSLMGESYDDALTDERKALKEYADDYGPAAKIGTELAGGLATIPLTMGAGSLAQAGRLGPTAARAVTAMMNNPLKTAVLGGAASGAVSGFGGGEGGLENRLEQAAASAGFGAGLGGLAYGAVKGAQKLGDTFDVDNRVANYLRSRIGTERGRKIGDANPNIPRTPEGDIDVNTSDFTDAAVRDLRKELGDQQKLFTRPMLSDVLPATSEAVVQKPSQGAERLASNMLKRQYDADLPEVAARGLSQHGRVEDAFDLAFGADTFRRHDEQLLETLRDNADRMFRPAYQYNLRGPEIEDALDRINILEPKIWKEAVKRAEASRRSIGQTNPITNSISSYNTEFLHDIKRQVDQALGEAVTQNPRFDQAPLKDAKRRLNEAIKAQNEPYRLAMKQYGDDADLINALKRGREEAFPVGSVDNRQNGMTAADIKAFLNDPNVPDAAKDLFKIGGARGLRERMLSPDNKKYTHNWADFINNPEMEQRIGAMLSDKLGSWDMMRSMLKKESENFKGVSKALMNSRTSAREELKKELEGSDLGRIVGAAAVPKAAGSMRAIADTLLQRVDPSRRQLSRTADILGRQGKAGNRQSLREVEEMLRAGDRRRDYYRSLGLAVPLSAGWGQPTNER